MSPQSIKILRYRGINPDTAQSNYFLSTLRKFETSDNQTDG